MDRLIYTAMTGATAANNRQTILSNNLANATTNGFRAQLETYRAVPLRGDGASTRVFALEASAGYVDRPGPAVRTERSLDVMSKTNNWFAVQARDGTEAYTRNGHFEVDTDGTLRTGNGLPVLSGDGSTLTVPQGAEVSIGADGSVNAKVPNQPANSVGRIKQATPVQGDPMVRGEDGLYRALSGEQLNNDATGVLQTGVLEGSNVNAVETMVGMIQTARQFEVQMRLMQSAESNDRTAGQLFGLQG